MLETTAVSLAMKRDERRAELVDRLDHAHVAHRNARQPFERDVCAGRPRSGRRTGDFARDHDFHTAFFDLAGNRYVEEMYDSLGAQVHRMRQVILRGDNDVREAVQEHEAILAAVHTGDAEAARSAMRTHIERARARSLRRATKPASFGHFATIGVIGRLHRSYRIYENRMTCNPATTGL